jgi:predicted DNA-binding transcriptional regulator AlpA
MNAPRKRNPSARQREGTAERTISSPRAVIEQQLGFIPEDELFALLGISLGTGRNRQSAGTMPPHYKVGRKKLYLISEVGAWIRRQRVARKVA